MFLRSSASIYPHIYLVTLGATCRYVLQADDGSLTISNPGSSAHVAVLSQRLKTLGLSPGRISRVLLTSFDAAKAGGLALFRKTFPKAQVIAPRPLQAMLKDSSATESVWLEDRKLSEAFNVPNPTSLEEFTKASVPDILVGDAEVVTLGGELQLRCLLTPGYQSGSATYVVLPQEFLIVDQTFGYYRGRHLAAPGADESLNAATAAVAKFEHYDISGIGFPFGGTITGGLVRKHLEALKQNCEDLREQLTNAAKEGIAQEEAQAQVFDAFYTPLVADPFLAASLQQSAEAAWKQLWLPRY